LVWPDPLTYVNRFWGGPVAGYRLVSDSNYDWGQGLKQLRQWVHKRQLEKIDVWYFGTDPMVHEPPFRLLPLHLLPIREPGDVLEHTRGSYLAVGTTLLYGTPMNDAQRAAAEFLRARQPVGRTDTFLIYDFTVARDS